MKIGKDYLNDYSDGDKIGNDNSFSGSGSFDDIDSNIMILKLVKMMVLMTVLII